MKHLLEYKTQEVIKPIFKNLFSSRNGKYNLYSYNSIRFNAKPVFMI